MRLACRPCTWLVGFRHLATVADKETLRSTPRSGSPPRSSASAILVRAVEVDGANIPGGGSCGPPPRSPVVDPQRRPGDREKSGVQDALRPGAPRSRSKEHLSAAIPRSCPRLARPRRETAARGLPAVPRTGRQPRATLLQRRREARSSAMRQALAGLAKDVRCWAGPRFSSPKGVDSTLHFSGPGGFDVVRGFSVETLDEPQSQLCTLLAREVQGGLKDGTVAAHGRYYSASLILASSRSSHCCLYRPTAYATTGSSNRSAACSRSLLGDFSWFSAHRA